MLVEKCPKKASSSTQIIQKVHSLHSESRNHRNNLRQNKPYNSSKMIAGVTIQTKRKFNKRNINTRNKFFKYSINNIPSFGGLRNSVSYISINTNMGSPWRGINESISRNDNVSKKKINLSNHVKNALL